MIEAPNDCASSSKIRPGELADSPGQQKLDTRRAENLIACTVRSAAESTVVLGRVCRP